MTGPYVSPAEKRVLDLAIQGRPTKEIANRLGVCEPTVKMHLSALFRKFEVNNRTALAAATAGLSAKAFDQMQRDLAKAEREQQRLLRVCLEQEVEIKTLEKVIATLRPDIAAVQPERRAG